MTRRRARRGGKGFGSERAVLSAVVPYVRRVRVVSVAVRQPLGAFSLVCLPCVNIRVCVLGHATRPPADD